MKIGLVGCGRWGKNILRDLLSLETDVYVCDPSPQSREAAISVGARRAVANVESLPADSDGYVVASPATYHLNNIVSLLPRGAPIFVEKPLVKSLEEFNILKSTHNAATTVFVMHKWRYHEGVAALKSLIEQATLGQVHGLRLQRTSWAEMHPDVDATQQLLPHDLSIILHLLSTIPPLDIVRSTPLGPSRFGFWASFRCPDSLIPVHLEIDNLLPPVSLRSCSIGFDHGVATFSSLQPDVVSIYRHDSPVADEINLPGQMPLLAELRAFKAHILGGPPPLSSLADESIINARACQIQECLQRGCHQ